MIGNIVKQAGIHKPKFSKFGEIQKGDSVVYYASKDYVITGIFEIESDIKYLSNDPNWKEIMIYKIKPTELPPPNYYLDFKKLVIDKNIQLAIFPDKQRWGKYLRGKTCINLTEEDYGIIKEAMHKKEYLKNINEIKITATKWHKKYSNETKKEISNQDLHQKAIDIWVKEEEKKFGLFKPLIKTNNVDINEIIPNDVWLKENKKFLDALAKLEIGGQPIYQSILEVQHKGSKEDLCVRVSIVLPFVTRVDVVSDEESLPQIRELLERIADPNIVKSRVKFYSFKEFLKG